MSTLEPPARISKPGGAALWLARMQMKHGRKLVIALPYIWLILLFLLPFLIVFKISLAEMARAIPPYTDLLEWADGQLSITLNLGNFLQLTDDPLYFEAYLQSLQIAGISTICCLLPAAGLPAGVGGGAQQALHAQYPAAVGDSALVDVFFNTRLCLDGHFEKQRCAEQCVAVARGYRSAADDPAH